MEEHKVPVQEELAVVASTKKHSWSKKERLALYVAGVFALVGIGFGGYTFYDQVIANAAGEDLLGSDISVDLPQPNESSYFKITQVGRQSIVIESSGDARRQVGDGSYQTNALAKGWRIEQSEDPADPSKWTTAADGDKSLVSTGGFLPILTDKCTYLVVKDNPEYAGVSANNVLQANHTYYFRASKSITSYDAQGTPSTTWEPQGNIVNVTTGTEPTFTVTSGSNAQVSLSWGSASQEPNHCTGEAYMVVRTSTISDFSNLSDRTLDPMNDKYDTNKNAVRKMLTSSGNGTLTAGSVSFTQPKNTAFYYALVRDSGVGTDQYSVLSSPQLVTVAATANILGDGTTTLTKPSVPANSITSTTTSTTVKNASYKWYPNGSITVKTWSPKSTSKNGSDCLGGFYPSMYSNGNLSTITGSYYGEVSDCKNIVPGTYTIKNLVIADMPDGSILKETTNDVQLTLTRVAPNLQIEYTGAGAKNPSIKAGKNATIHITNFYVKNYSFLPEGQLIVKNVTTGKVLKTVTLGTNTSSINITLKKMKKGKYNLAVIYKASTNPGIFQDKTVNLPKLTVK